MKHFYSDVPGWSKYITDFYRIMVQALPEGAQVVEVGTHWGRSAAFMAVEMANAGKGQHLTCVDLWEDVTPHLKGPKCADEGFPIATLEAFVRNMQPLHEAGHADIVTVLPKASVEAAEEFQDESLDLVFLDGDHSYEGVDADIKAWWPKVKQGGILGGHDFGDIAVPGVTVAVRKWFGYDLTIYGTVWSARKPVEIPIDTDLEASE